MKTKEFTMNTENVLASATESAAGGLVGNALDAAQKAIIGATTKAMTEGNVKLALAAGAGAVLVGTAFLVYEYGGAAADAVSEGASEAATWIADSVIGFFLRSSIEIIPIFEGAPEDGMVDAAFV
jgi:hypothetical protein